MSHHTRRAARSLIALTAIAAAALAGTSLAPTSAQSLPPTGDCAVPFAVADLAKGQPVNGLTVSSGTTPEAFTGEVLGVLNDGIAPGLDMVMVTLTSPEIDRAGVWAGMSGSPVYAADGKLIGAVAYGLAWGHSPVAGVTPFAEMDDYVGAPAARIKVSDAVARTIAAATDVTAREASAGFTQLPMPQSVSGVRAARLSKTRGRAYLDKNAHAMGAASAPGVGPGVETIVAGGNLALSAAYGDVTLAAVGTATSVCGDRVVGFGHPATFAGKLTAGLHPADAIYVQEDLITSFKVANVGAPVGTITDDHLTGITGSLGPLPTTSGVSSTVTYGSRNRTGSSEVSIPRYIATTTFYESVGNHERVLDGDFAGSELATWVISGHRADGSTFTVNAGDRYVSSSSIIGEAIWDAPDMVWLVSQFPGVVVDDVAMTADVTDDVNMWTVSAVQYRSGGSWKTVPARGKVPAVAGKTLKLRAVVVDGTDKAYLPVSVAIPAKLAGGRGDLQLTGGGSLWSDFFGAETLDEFLKSVDGAVRNDEVVAEIFADSPNGFFSKQVASDPSERVVEGRKRFTLVIK